MAHDTITEMSEAVTANPLWAGSSMNLSFRNRDLTWLKLDFWVKTHEAMDDLTPNEKLLVAACRKMLDEYNASWEF